MKRILIFIVTALFVCDLQAQFKTLQDLSNYVTDSVKKRPDKITANTLNKAYQGMISFMPDVVEDTGTVSSPKHGFIRFQRKDSTAYVYDTTGTKRWRKYVFGSGGSGGPETDPQFDTKFSGKTTDNLSEGGTNKYFTNARARGAFSADAPLLFDVLTGKYNLDTNSATGLVNRARIYKALDSVANIGIKNQNSITQAGNFKINGNGSAHTFRTIHSTGNAGYYFEGVASANNGIWEEDDDITHVSGWNRVDLDANGLNKVSIYDGHIDLNEDVYYSPLPYTSGGYKIGVFNNLTRRFEYVPKDSLGGGVPTTLQQSITASPTLTTNNSVETGANTLNIRSLIGTSQGWFSVGGASAGLFSNSVPNDEIGAIGVYASGTPVSIEAHKGSNANISSSMSFDPDSIVIRPFQGNIKIPSLKSAPKPKAMLYDPENGSVSYGDYLTEATLPEQSLYVDGGALVRKNDSTITTNIVNASDTGVVTPEMKAAWDNKQNAIGYTPENAANKSTVTTLGTSDVLFPTQNAVKTYVDNAVSGVGGGSGESSGFTKQTFYLVPNAGITQIQSKGLGNNSLSGTQGTLTSRSVSNASLLSSLVRVSLVTAGSASAERAAYACPNNFWIGNASGLGGFDIKGTLAFPQITANRTIFFGMTANTAGWSGTSQTANLTNTIGIAVDSLETNWQFITNDGSGATTRVDTGIPVNTSDVLSLRVSVASNGTAFSVTFKTSSGGSYVNTNVNSNIPANDVFLRWFVQNQSNSTTQVISSDFIGLYAETPINF